MVENFSWLSFGAGVASGVAATVAVNQTLKYRNNKSVDDPPFIERTATQTTLDKGYLQYLIELARTSHLFGHQVKLDDILIEPYFIRPPELVELPGEDTELMRSVFDVVPQVHDYPYLHSPYHLPDIEIDDLGRGHGTLLVIGNPGSGRTTALLTIALWSAGLVEFKQPDDIVARKLRGHDADVSPEEQAEQVKQRLALIESVNKRMEDARAQRGESVTKPDPEEEKIPLEQRSRFRRLTPLYVHLANVLPTTGEYGQDVDPAEPFIRGLQVGVGRVTAKRLVGKTYDLLTHGAALVLIDGYDDLPCADRPAAIAWLQQFIKLYAANFIIVAMPPADYTALIEVGAIPVFLRPWNEQEQIDCAITYAAVWENLSKNPLAIDRNVFPDPQKFYTEMGRNARGMNAFDTTLHTWSHFNGTSGNESQQMDRYLRSLLPDAESLMARLSYMAALQLDTGYITLPPLIAQATKNDITLPAENADDAAKQARDTHKAQNELLKKLVDGGVLLRFRAERYQFRHTLLTAYLAARFIEQADEAVLLSKQANPDWDTAICYLAQMRDIDVLVSQQLAQDQMDILHDRVLKVTQWLRFADTNAKWRNGLLRYLGNLMVANHQFTLVRERIAAALLGIQDAGILVIFRRALSHPNPDIRKLGCLAIGVLRDAAAIKPLLQIVLQDQYMDVQVAAALALGIIGSDQAWMAIGEAFAESEGREVQQAIAESLAANREEGYLTLLDAIKAPDMMMRRSAAFGLGRIRSLWALVTLNEAFLGDSEFYVQLAAESIFVDIYEASLKGITPYPDVQQAAWLSQWINEQIEHGKLPFDIPSAQFLDAALRNQDDDLIRELAIITISQLGLTDWIGDLYTALLDPSESVRDAAYRALGEFQQCLGQTLPAPTP